VYSGRDSWPELGERELHRQDHSNRTRRLPWRARHPQDQRQQTHPSDASIAFGDISEPFQWFVEPDWTGLRHPHRQTLQRYQSPGTVLETRRGEEWSAVAELHTLRRTHATLLSQSGASPQGRPGPAGARTHLYHDGYLHSTHPSASAGGVDRLAHLVTNGDELAVWEADVAL
jgi:hypothetical protein